MNKVEMKKRAAVGDVATYLLDKGLHESGLRRLAQAAGTSDRMLIYYFGSKDELLNQVLGSIAAGLTNQLDALLGTHRRPAPLLLEELTAAASEPSFWPAIRLWFELVGLAARGNEPYLSNAQILAQNWVNWINTRSEKLDGQKAKDLFAHLEGRLLLKLIQEV